MKFKVTSACFYNKGTPAAEGEIINVDPDEAYRLEQAGRGHKAESGEVSEPDKAEEAALRAEAERKAAEEAARKAAEAAAAKGRK